MISHATYLDLIAPLRQRCCCGSPVFQKLVGFNFEDYSIPPTSLWDAEILIHELIRKEFLALEQGTDEQGDPLQMFQCKRCHRICRVVYCQYSINMERTYARFEDDLRAPEVCYLLGFRTFNGAELAKIFDYQKREDGQGYIGLLLATSGHEGE